MTPANNIAVKNSVTLTVSRIGAPPADELAIETGAGRGTAKTVSAEMRNTAAAVHMSRV